MEPRIAALALLELPESATPEQITHAFRRLAKSTHPDVTGPTDHDAASRFAALTTAYRLLLETRPPDPSPSPPLSPTSTTRPRGPVPIPVRVRRPPIVVGPVRVSPLPRSRL